MSAAISAWHHLLWIRVGRYFGVQDIIVIRYKVLIDRLCTNPAGAYSYCEISESSEITQAACPLT